MVAEADVNKVIDARYMWMMINNLKRFDSQPNIVFELIEKFKELSDHPFVTSFENIIAVVEEFYNNKREFPDYEWLKLRFKGVRNIDKFDDPFSMQMYEELMRYLNIEIIKKGFNRDVAQPLKPTTDALISTGRAILRAAERDLSMEESTKESIINGYEDYRKGFNGVRTWIKPIDEAIGVLGHKSLSVLAAPSGHGKSTFAFSLASNVARHGGFVEYLSFEVPKEHVWFNLVSNYSQDKKHPLPASAIKCCELTEEQRGYYNQYAKELLADIGDANGMVHVIDQSSTTGDVNTFDDLCAYLESIAEKRKRRADLIIVDNIDNFQTLRNTTREDEITRMNNYIINLDGYCKRYCNNEGTAIFLLSQVNRSGMKTLNNFADDSKSTRVDVTCVQKYNALYEKPTCVMIGFADETARSQSRFRVHVAKLRNKQTPVRPITLTVKYEFSKIMGEDVTKREHKTQEDFNKNAQSLYNNDKERIPCDIKELERDFDSDLDDDDE